MGILLPQLNNLSTDYMQPIFCIFTGMEKWVAIKGIFKSGYYVSDDGRIMITKKTKTIVKAGSLDAKGYLEFSYEKGFPSMKVHFAVLNSFTERPKWAECVNHKNGIKTDNRLDNLEWCTLKLNTEHAHRTGLIDVSGEKHPRSYPISIVHQIYTLKLQGKRPCEIMKELGIPRGRVQAIFSGRDWKHEYKKYFPCAILTT